MSAIDAWLSEKRHIIDRVLDARLPAADTPPAIIHEAMRYAVLGGGKRIRPILAIAAAEACGANVDELLVPIAALELIHTYSLVHDDLPALDNDDLRRGRKTTHVVFGEAMAILTGDALLTEAFSWVAEPIGSVEPAHQLRAVRELAMAVDSKGMIGGQVADIIATGTSEATAEQLDFIHRNKTGKLLTASVVLGGLLANASRAQIEALRDYGNAIGLAFQIVDDLLDQEEDAATLGKTAGKDLAQGKLTYPALFGTDAARAAVDALLVEAIHNAGMISNSVNYLAPIARFICERRS
ncbi:MAG: geranylgeranyl diphosphate synthase, type [Thermoanaerobaculia bacterium]|nr:geranylgeranyl diphosphate synthase, type [Thermoanaerobaculia bacterium]